MYVSVQVLQSANYIQINLLKIEDLHINSSIFMQKSFIVVRKLAVNTTLKHVMNI